MTVLIGADPEVFLFKNGNVVSAHDLIPGTKKEPFKVECGALQVDGTAAEFNIDPAATEDEFVHNINEVMRQLQTFVPDLEIRAVPTVTFPADYFKALPEESKELGCDPDFNAHKDGAENPRPDNLTTMRSGGGHVHLGFTEGADPRDRDHINRCITLIKHLDAFLGLPSLEWDRDVNRRRLYGKGGAFRPKSYGVEYRTLSNVWVSSEDLMRLVFRNSQRAVESLMAGDRLPDYDLVNSYINDSFHPYPLRTYPPFKDVINKVEWRNAA